MKQRFLFLLTAFVATAMETGVVLAQAAPSPPPPPKEWFVYGVIISVFLAVIVALLLIRLAVADSKFSLSDALSEDTEITWMDNNVPKTGPDGKPLTITVMTASISRLIALMGTIMLVILFLGFGVFVMYYFAMGRGVPSGTNDVVKFMVAGLTLFAPYVVNKFSNIFEALAPKKP